MRPRLPRVDWSAPMMRAERALLAFLLALLVLSECCAPAAWALLAAWAWGWLD